jgi:Flp pilus assembly protein TadG
MNAAMPIVPTEIFRSVEIIWILWLVSVAALIVFTSRAITRMRKARLRRIHRSETGAAYTLSLVMVIPIYLFMICLVVETTLVLCAKCGTIYAAYQASRAGVVWSSSAQWPEAEDKMQQAAIEAMVPFASGTNPGTKNKSESPRARKYLDAYKAYTNKPAHRPYLAAKYRYAEKSVTVTSNGPPAAWHSDITAEVTYQFPFNVPGIGRLLGKRGSDGEFYFPIISQATLQNEGPKNAAQSLGIKYASPR